MDLKKNLGNNRHAVTWGAGPSSLYSPYVAWNPSQVPAKCLPIREDLWSQ